MILGEIFFWMKPLTPNSNAIHEQPCAPNRNKAEAEMQSCRSGVGWQGTKKKGLMKKYHGETITGRNHTTSLRGLVDWSQELILMAGSCCFPKNVRGYACKIHCTPLRKKSMEPESAPPWKRIYSFTNHLLPGSSASYF